MLICHASACCGVALRISPQQAYVSSGGAFARSLLLQLESRLDQPWESPAFQSVENVSQMWGRECKRSVCGVAHGFYLY